MTLREKILAADAPASVILIRFCAAAIFLSEGIQKFLFPVALGVGRFQKIGIPAPHILAPFVGVVEIVCGALLALGLLTRLAAIPLVIDMMVAAPSTKIPVLVKSGFWAMAHEVRTDYAMFMSSIFLLLAGAGPWSVDALLARRALNQHGQR